MLEAIIIVVAAFAVAVVYATFAEWVIHGTFMHKPLARFRHFYHGHAEVHHGVYGSDSTYLVGDRPRVDITLALWAMPFPVLAHMPALVVIAIFVGLPVAAGVFAALTLYQASYEYLHYCMHVPGDRWLERTRFFQFVQLHHRLHHVFYLKNLNVVVPIADFVLRTRVKMPESDFFEKIERARLRKLERAQAKADEPVLAESAAQLEHVS